MLEDGPCVNFSYVRVGHGTMATFTLTWRADVPERDKRQGER